MPAVSSRMLALLALALCYSRSAVAEVWTGDRVIDSPVEIRGESLRIDPGARIAFKGNGRIRIEDGSLTATRAAFEARSTLTNDFRIIVQNGRLTIGHCSFRGMKAQEAGGKDFRFIDGFLRNQYGHGSHIEDNRFIDCSAMMLLNASHVEIARNLAIRCDHAFSLLNCTECRIESNEFFNAPTAGLKVNGVRLSDVFRNRFTDCKAGLFAYHCKENRFMGNAFFGGNEGLKLWGLGPKSVVVGNRFEGVAYPISKHGETSADAAFRDNETGKGSAGTDPILGACL